MTADVFADGHDVLAGGVALPEVRARRTGARFAMAPLGNDRWQRRVRGGRARRLRVHRRRLGRSLRDVAARSWRRSSGPDRTSRASCSKEPRLSRRTVGRTAIAAGRARRARALSDDASERRMTQARRPQRARTAIRSHPRGDRRARTRAVRRLVRDVPALGRHRSLAQRDVRRSGGAAALHRAMGFDVLYLPPIHPIGRSFRKGREQLARRAARRSRQPVGDRRGRGRAHGVEPGLGTLEDFDRFVEAAASVRASRSRSTSPSRRRPTIRTSRSTRSGSGIGPTARSSTRRTRRRNTRTSTRSTSSRTTGRRSGTS